MERLIAKMGINFKNGPTPYRGAVPNPAKRRRQAFSAVAFLAALAVGLLFLLPGGLLQAQDDGMIEYPENGMAAVATFTADDPEDRMVYWSLPTTAPDALPTGFAGTDFTDSDAAHFSINSSGVLSFRFSPDYEMPMGGRANTNTYRVVVAASDDPPGAGADDMPIMMGYKKVTVMVTDQDEPGMVTLSAQQAQINAELTAELTDDDATSSQIGDAKWKWEHSSTENGPWTEILTTTESTYTPLGVEDKYLRVTATYTDEHGSDKSVQVVSAYTVRAMPPNNAAPVFSDEDDEPGGIQVDRKVDENSPPGTNVGKPVTANDAPGDVLTYTFSGDGADDSSYKIDPATGQITVGPRTALNREPDNTTDTVSVIATDPSGLATTQSVTITINNLNEAPMIEGGATRASVDENTAMATAVSTYEAMDVDQTTAVTWSVSGTDMGDFEISNQAGTIGELTFKKVPDYEKPVDSNGDNVYMVTVVATDAGVDDKNKMTAERAVVVTVKNIEEDGTVTLSSVQPKIGFPLTASVTDLDDGVMDTTWKWERDVAGTATSASDCSATNLANLTWQDAEDGMGAKTATYTPDAKDEGKCLRATATYTDGKGMDETMGVSGKAVVADEANRPPRFRTGGVDSSDTTNADTGDTAMSAKRSINENVAPNTAEDPDRANVGMPVVADDPNDDNLTYTLNGTDAGSFDIDPADGQISANMKLDREAKSSHMVTVTATDPDGASASIDVTITVTNVDEAPEIAGDDVTTDYRENGTAQVARFTADDPEDRRMVYWSVLADDATFSEIEDVEEADAADEDHFMISSDGVLRFKFSPDYEMPMGGSANTYRVVVVASDDPTGAGTDDMPIMMGYKKVTVNVTDVEEAETVTLSAQQGQVGVALTATYNDADNEKPAATNLTWKWFLGGTPISGAGDGDTGLTSTYDAPANPGTHRVEASYTKTDGSKKAVSATISVRAEPNAGNATPVFPSGSNARSVDENSPPGTNVGRPVNADDTGGDRLHYTLTDTTNTFTINPATGQITVAPRQVLNADSGGTASYTVTVTATDPFGAGGTPPGAATQSVTITINNLNEAPMIEGGATRASVDENTAMATAVSTYEAMDVDQTTAVTWSVSGTDMGDFEISNQAGTIGELTFKKVPDYEKPVDSNGDNVYMVTVVATDAGVDDKNKMTAERAVVVTVKNIEEDGTVTLSSVQPKIGFPLTASVTDLDDGVMDTTWKWERDVAGTATSASDCSATNLANLTWQDAEDGMGAKTATYTPDAKDEGKCLRATATYTDGKGMDETMGVSANAVVKDEANRPPRFRVGGVDSSDTTNADTGDTATSAKRSINENVAPNTAEDPDRANVGMPVVADDPNDDVLTYTLNGTDAGSFDIDPADGQISANMKLDREAKSSHMVTVTATDPDGASASIDVTITVTNVDEAPKIMRAPEANVAPEFASAATSRMVAENTVAGQDIGTPVAATDHNRDTLAYTLGGTDMASFDIGSATGQLMTQAALDYEAKASYEVMVTATDPEGASDMITVTITVTNEEETGEVTLWAGTDALTMAPQVGDTITGAVMDPDDGVTGESWQWARTMTPNMMDSWMPITGATDAAYMVMAGDEGYYLRVMATYTDAAGMAMEYSMPTMMVGAVVDEPGMVTLWAGDVALTMAPEVGDTITGAVMDPDGGVTVDSWQWARTMTPDMMDSWMPITGATDAAYMVMEGDTGYYLRVMATYTDAVGTDMAMVYSMPTMMVGAEAGDPLVNRYDLDNNGIDKPEVLKAINDYLFGEGDEAISKPEVLRLINLYLFP